ncbi:RHS repeat-associated core domain-containing protein [Flammeovirga aprica]|uniref:RHS repeat-associated core domain-containing protein n=1 Tax=Flammeovirga aprica JL-4 TaxID=694437 RepID=A0A7X9S1A4_9BACT|nr:RHS repeat-associated core domain-containing protein [Flammeovirga aprica]NME72571.1 hypothetical protein [Flammeovirga aprica JL-4]
MLPLISSQVRFFDENDQLISKERSFISKADQRQQLQLPLTAPEHTAYMKIGIFNQSEEVNAYFDNLKVTFNDYIVQENHYYPFGMNMAGIEKKGTPDFKFQFNVKEKEEEIGFIDYGARHYDASLGRWFVVDPMSEKYYSISNYTYCVNNPIFYNDINGEEIVLIGSGEFKWKILNTLVNLLKEDKGSKLINFLASNERTVISETEGKNYTSYGKGMDGEKSAFILFNLSSNKSKVDGVPRTYETSLMHELTHAQQYINGERSGELVINPYELGSIEEGLNTRDFLESEAVDNENYIRDYFGLNIRRNYNGIPSKNSKFKSSFTLNDGSINSIYFAVKNTSIYNSKSTINLKEKEAKFLNSLKKGIGAKKYSKYGAFTHDNIFKGYDFSREKVNQNVVIIDYSE